MSPQERRGPDRPQKSRPSSPRHGPKRSRVHGDAHAGAGTAQRLLPVRLGVRFELTLTVVGPVMILLAVVAHGIAGRLTVLHDLRELSEVAPLIEQTAALVHEIQRERGLSAPFLGSTGSEFGDELDEQVGPTSVWRC